MAKRVVQRREARMLSIDRQHMQSIRNLYAKTEKASDLLHTNLLLYSPWISSDVSTGVLSSSRFH